MGEIPLALSFDDVLLVPQESEILPSEVQLKTVLTDKITLNIPVLSSAMDTVTEAEMAISLAREGGLGVIHRNCSIEKQADFVARVKRAENTVIQNPFTVDGSMTIDALKEVMEVHGVSGFPVIDQEGVLEGMVTSRDLWNVDDDAVLVRDVMTTRDCLITSPASTSLEKSRSVLYKNRIEKLPLVDDAGRLAGLITRKDIEIREMYSEACIDENGQLRVGAAVGVGEHYLERAQALVEAGCDVLFIDAATGHTSRVIHVVTTLKKKFPSIPIAAGNVVTVAGAQAVIDAGAAIVKIGVGPGSICTTRVIAGVGVPQFSAVFEVAQYCRERGVTAVADGGVRYSGDMVKALAAGADAVMLGSLLAGTRESPGETVNWQGRTFKEYRGMGSLKAMRHGSSDRYGQNNSEKMVAEGVEARVPYRGQVREMVFQLMGGLRSGMGYVGAADLQALRKKAQFVRITSGGLKESHPHDIVITEEPINYQRV